MLGLLRVVPIWAWALLAAVAWGGVQYVRARSVAADLAAVHAETARQRELGLTASINETERRLAAQQEAADHAAKTAARARADAAAARTAGQRLRTHAASLAASAGACHPAAAAVGEAASAPAVVLAELLGRLDARGRELAAEADDRGVAGGECAARYDALSAGR